MDESFAALIEKVKILSKGESQDHIRSLIMNLLSSLASANDSHVLIELRNMFMFWGADHVFLQVEENGVQKIVHTYPKVVDEDN